jgi:2',3'-cyclic-nucleotide 2'-phosphodiesterase (5'-nucleotidase family)
MRLMIKQTFRRVFPRVLMAALLLYGATYGWTEETKRLRILYLNDFHGYAEPHQPAGSSQPMGGIAALAQEAQRLRAGQPSLLLAAGDMIQGNQWANFFQGESSVRLMNALGFDALVLGNHEFDFGLEVLQRRLAEAAFPVLGANVEGLSGVRPYVIKEIGGWRVLIIGLVTADTPVMTHPRNVAGLTFQDPVRTLQHIEAKTIKDADLVIVLSHLGFPADRRLAQEVPGIHLIVGGHTHTRIEKPQKVNGTWIVQAWEYGKTLGCLDLIRTDGRITLDGGRLITIDPQKGSAPEIAALVENYGRQVQVALDKVIGEALIDLDGRGTRERETNLGNLLTDRLRQETGAEVAILNGGGIRADIPAGSIRVRQIMDVLPFNNFPVVLRLTGSEIKELLEHGVSEAGGHGGKFPQVSGVVFVYRTASPSGRRVFQVEIGGQPLEPERLYTVATNDFLAAGGDGYAVFKQAFPEQASRPDWKPEPGNSRVVLYDRGRSLQEMVTDYIRKQQKITAVVEGRIRIE